MDRIDRTFNGLRVTGRKALSVYLTAGYPSPELTVRLAAGLASAGADLLEIGIPFSDPIADGPVIRACSARALAAPTTTADVLAMVREIRKSTGIPVILMGYVNPLLAYGMDRFIDDAAASGADGMIVPDLPAEESLDYRRLALESRIAPVFMITPTTPDRRIAALDRLSAGFLYAVRLNGVTGRNQPPSGPRNEERQGTGFLARAKKLVTRNPLLAGFGISDPVAARASARFCDGVIVGSAVLERLRPDAPDEGYGSAVDFISTLRSALDAS